MSKRERIDNLTPKYRELLEGGSISIQERKVLVGIARELKHSLHFTSKDIRDKVGIRQHSHLSAILTRLVKKGFIERTTRGAYKFLDMDLILHLRVRCLKMNRRT